MTNPISRRRTITLVALACTAAAPVAVTASGVAGAATTKTITMKNIRYSPTAVTISRNDKVKYVWRDGSIRHDVRFKSGGFRASPLKSTGTYTLTFKRSGSFRFFCSVHSEMKGRVTVR